MSVIANPVYAVGNLSDDFKRLPVVRDETVGQDATGSIVGLYTALLRARTDWAAILACDLPFVTGDLMTRLADYCSDEYDAIVPVQSDTNPQPLCAFYMRERCLPVVEAMIRKDDLKMQRLLSRVSASFVEIDEIADLDGSANFFLNVNRPEDYETALKISAC